MLNHIGLQQLPGRDLLLPRLPAEGGPDELPGDDPAHPVRLHLQRPARARPPGHLLHTARQDPAHGHLLPAAYLPRGGEHVQFFLKKIMFGGRLQKIRFVFARFEKSYVFEIE